MHTGGSQSNVVRKLVKKLSIPETIELSQYYHKTRLSCTDHRNHYPHYPHQQLFYLGGQVFVRHSVFVQQTLTCLQFDIHTWNGSGLFWFLFIQVVNESDEMCSKSCSIKWCKALMVKLNRGTGRYWSPKLIINNNQKFNESLIALIMYFLRAIYSL